MPGAISSLLLIVVGAIARYAYSDSVWRWTAGGESHALRVDTIGAILLVAGILGLFLSLIWSFLYSDRFDDDEDYEKEVVVDKVPGESPRKIVRKRRRKY